ncbi:MAG TPA: hypothetical protein VMU16_10280 [Candidatus Binataceae bacterium]|nr:hypothetical protein [Candidatus Binataceae bacterium]
MSPLKRTLYYVSSSALLTIWLWAPAGVSRALAQAVVDGGLNSPETGWTLGPNLLNNGNFSAGTTGWTMTKSCFSLDPTTPAPNGAASLMLQDPATCSTTSIMAVNSVTGTSGNTYTISGQIKTDNLTGTQSYAGARIDLFPAGATNIMNGTNDWTPLTLQHVVVGQGTTAPFRLESYSFPSGTAWFANLSLQREIPPPLRMFLLYPNYRGLMFSDQNQTASFAFTVAPPDGTTLASVRVYVEAADQNGNVVASNSFAPTSSEFTGPLDMSALAEGNYQVTGELLDASGNVLFTQSPYSIVKLDASARANMSAWVDSSNQAHFLDGNAHFVLGMYDTTAYSNSPAYYEPDLAAIAQAPINMMINYYITLAPPSAIEAYTTEMKQYGITFLPTVSTYYSNNPNYPSNLATMFGATNQDQLAEDYAETLASDPQIVGYYVQDEPQLAVQPQTFHQYSMLKAGNPAGFNYAVLSRPLDVPSWRDTVDVMGVDPYPIVNAANNNLAQVGDWTRLAVQGVHGARPVWTVIQFFQQTCASAWPTEQQLHDMSWMAIVEGATGLFYWEYGLRGLYEVKDPVEHQALYQELVDVTSEIKSLEPVLLMPDAPVLSANSATGTIITKTKDLGNGTRYVFAYNHSNAPVTVQLTLNAPAAYVAEYGEGVTLMDAAGTMFSADFQPYQAHVFEISNTVSEGAPTPVTSQTPTASATATLDPPTPTPSSTPTRTMSVTPTASPTMTRTSTATPTVTATPTTTLTRTTTPTATATVTHTPTMTVAPTATPTPTRRSRYRRHATGMLALRE